MAEFFSDGKSSPPPVSWMQMFEGLPTLNGVPTTVHVEEAYEEPVAISPLKKCVECGGAFRGRQHNAKTCSAECYLVRNKAMRKRAA
jgi:hypothetical protein